MTDEENEEGFLTFGNLSIKKQLIGQLMHLVEAGKFVREVGYTCGECAAFPCFRNRREDTPGGLCFQVVRRCRQECEHYLIREKRDSSGEICRFPANGGSCKMDESSVEYNQDCHIEDMRYQKKR